MKRILGLDLGTTSIGWALVDEATEDNEKSKIIKLGVRANPLTTDELTDFEKGRPLSVNADRTLKRGARRNLQRFKLRRNNLVEILTKHCIISKDTSLTEIGKNTTHQTLSLRAKAARKKIELEELAKVFLAINKKRGYKSSRKAKNEEEGNLIDGMAIAKELYDKKLTPGQYVYELLNQGKKYIPEFYRSDLQAEFDAIWGFQKQFYPEILVDTLYKELLGKNKTQTWAICEKPFGIVGIKQEGKTNEKRLQRYQWRVKGLTEQLESEYLAIVLQEINNNLNKSSGYLGAISDRSKELYFNNETVGENLYNQLLKTPHTSLRNQVFYRQDYLDEFEQIWETQANFYTELTSTLKQEIRDVIIFYQRKLKSQKHLISNCEFEKHHKAVPRSSPLFQEFKIWQVLNNLEFKNKTTKEVQVPDKDLKQLLFEELNLRGNLKPNEIMKIVGLPTKEWSLNYKEAIEGNRTNQALYSIYQQIAENEGYGFEWPKKSAKEIKEELKIIFPQIGIKPSILDFDAELDGGVFDKQESYQFWHLLYSSEDDSKILEKDKLVYGNSNVALKKKLDLKYGFKPEYGNLLVNITFQPDYGSLSARAIRKILPFLKSGNEYSEACQLASYNHSHSMNNEERANRSLKDKLELLKKNSLRNPVVEKILNQMINLINLVIETYGKPEEIRIELARELKKSASERADTTKYINTATKKNEEVRKIIAKDFGIPNPTRNDVIKYKLYEELSENGHKTLFTNQYIPREKLFSKEIDIEHVIPKAMLFDDSFSNKTLAYRNVNLKKADRTAFDFIENDYNNDLENYKSRVGVLYKKGKGSISKGKYKKLLMSKENLPDGFIERDLRNSQYIAKKAKQLLEEVFRTVNTTTGRVTDKLREDWDLINVMKELNLPKYRTLGLTEMQERKEGKKVEQIIDWTKRNDHRHHAMDALTVAFTSYSHIQYLNNLSASRDKENSTLYGIRNKITKQYVNKNGGRKRRFVPPMNNFREDAKQHIEGILISFKAKNKVVTKNKNRTKLGGKDKYNEKTQLTPRGQLHKETVYGKSKRAMEKATKLNKRFSLEQAKMIVDKDIRVLVLGHLKKHQNNPEIGFDTKILKKEPLIYKDESLKEVRCFEEIYTIRKDISPDLKVDKVVDEGVKKVLQQRLVEFDNKPKEAFSNLDKNPIWLNKAKEISIKRVTITGVSNAEPLHFKKDHLGIEILDKNNQKQAVDFVSTGNNHHVAIYRDSKEKLQEKVVSFYEAVARVNEGLSIIDKEYNSDQGWEFLFTMKQNEMFVFPSEDFDLQELDLMDEKNAPLISKYLFRVQKISTKNYLFAHHLETKAINGEDLKNKKMLSQVTYHSIRSTEPLDGIIKVRTDHIGKIVQIGEY
ncbi:CRISPR-associated endonuclease Cas9 [hydrothermal vent metagenome]|uniref:CRISPR-associated endonuclease Cas9 n=1 Tax=hydrothermal vent metagenome TaxID=652676 RepID=A0A3B0TMI6_9ZZZZ